MKLGQLSNEIYIVLIYRVCTNYLSEYFAKPYFHKYWTEMHDVPTIWKGNVCRFITDHDVQIAVEMRVEPTQSPVKNLVRQRCAEGFNSGVKGLTYIK
jgi:hypothetical protein